jgi:copper chaperone CopZ
VTQVRLSTSRIAFSGFDDIIGFHSLILSRGCVYFIIKKITKMQKLKILISVLLFSIPFLLNAQIQKAEFQASGLTCSMCSNAINKALKTLPFIESINVDLNRNLFTISFSKKATADIDAIKKKVEDAGFSIAKFWIYIDGDNQQVSNDEHIVLGGREFHFMHVSPQTLNGL